MDFIRIKNTLIKTKNIDKIYLDDKAIVITTNNQSMYIYYNSSTDANNAFYEICKKLEAT